MEILPANCRFLPKLEVIDNGGTKKEPPKIPDLVLRHCPRLMAVLNTILMPQLDRMQTKEIDYGTFLTMLENGEIKEVQKDGDVIAFNTNDENDRTIYVTGAWMIRSWWNACRKQASNFQHHSQRGISLALSARWSDPSDRSVVGRRLSADSEYAEKDGRPQCDVLRQKQCEDLCGGPNRQNLRGCSQERTKQRKPSRKLSTSCTIRKNMNPSVRQCPRALCL